MAKYTNIKINKTPNMDFFIDSLVQMDKEEKMLNEEFKISLRKVKKMKIDFLHFIFSHNIKNKFFVNVEKQKRLSKFLYSIKGFDIIKIVDIFDDSLYWVNTKEGKSFWRNISYLWKKNCIEKRFVEEKDVLLFETYENDF